MSNPEGVEKGVRSVTLDGCPVEGNILPVQPAGKRVSVLVRMG